MEKVVVFRHFRVVWMGCSGCFIEIKMSIALLESRRASLATYQAIIVLLLRCMLFSHSPTPSVSDVSLRQPTQYHNIAHRRTISILSSVDLLVSYNPAPMSRNPSSICSVFFR